MTPVPTPADIELLADGALSVAQATEFSGLSRTALFSLMRRGELVWFTTGAGPGRLIVRKSLVALLAALYREHMGAR